MNAAAERGYCTLYGNNDGLFLRRLGATRKRFPQPQTDIA